MGLAIRNVTKVYPNLLKALDDVSLEIGTGVYGLLGPNGAGKSTLLSILAGELDCERGRIVLDGESDLRRHPGRWRRLLGYVPQTLDFVPHLTGKEYLRQCALLSRYAPRSLVQRMDELLTALRLADAADRDAAGYSRGMKQRLALAGALLCRPRLLLLDEPTSGLDPQERVYFRGLLAEIAPHHIVILSTHIVSDVERCCDRIGVIDRGRLVFDGSPGDLLTRVEGRVWEMPVEREEVAAEASLKREDCFGRPVVSLRETDGQLLARVIGGAQPANGSAVVPRLEDAYMDLVGERGLAALTQAPA